MKKPVLLLGRVPRIVITVARSLHNYGIPVDVANWEGPRLYSRAIRKFFRLPDPQTFNVDFIDRIREIVHCAGHDVLFPTDDEALATVIENYDVLKELLVIACPPPDVTRLVLNKSSTLEIAQQCGIAVPPTILVSSSAQLWDITQTLRFPWVLKPAAKLQQAAETKSRRIRNEDELAKYFPTAATFVPPLLVQECCRGDGVGVEMLLHRGESLATFQHRRIKEFPHDGGAAVTAVAEIPDPALVRFSLSLLRVLNWEGVAMVEYKVDPVDGKSVLMEVNGRYWGSLSLAVCAGFDFPLYHWKVLHGIPPDVPAIYKVGTRWRWTEGFFKRIHGLVRAARRSRAARKTLVSDLWQFPLDFSISTNDSLLMLSDPLPALCEAGATTKELLRYLYDDVRGMKKRYSVRYQPN